MDVIYEAYIVEQLAVRGKKQISVVIYESLRKMILEGQLALDARINEQYLAKAVGVSRTPLRKALDQLVAEQLVAYEENRGVRVVNINEETIHEVFTIQLQLEQLLYSEASRKLSDQQIKDLVSELGQLKFYELTGQFDQLQQLADQFKGLIISLTRTPILKHLLEELSIYSKRLSHLQVGDLRQQQIALREQLVILNSLLSKEDSILETALRQQMRRSRHQTLGQYRRKLRVPAEETASERLTDTPSLTMFICKEVTCPLHVAFQAMLERQPTSAY